MSGGASLPQEVGHLKNYLAVTANFAQAAWNTVAKHEVFTVSGLVRMQVVPEIVTDLTSGGAATIQLGDDGNTARLIAATLLTNLTAGKLLLNTTPVALFNFTSCFDQIVNGNDFGYEILVAALTGGSIKFHCYWEPLDQNSPGSVVAGTGSTL